MDTIFSLKIGEVGIIKQFNSDEVPLKLQEMGCIPGQEVELIQTSYAKDPIHIRINDTHLAIRRNLAAAIEIDKI